LLNGSSIGIGGVQGEIDPDIRGGQTIDREENEA
jgi:hypothetical protein